jgi:hypothetical protein
VRLNDNPAEGVTVPSKPFPLGVSAAVIAQEAAVPLIVVPLTSSETSTGAGAVVSCPSSTVRVILELKLQVRKFQAAVNEPVKVRDVESFTFFLTVTWVGGPFQSSLGLISITWLSSKEIVIVIALIYRKLGIGQQMTSTVTGVTP